MKKTAKRLAIFAQYSLGNEMRALKNIRDRLVASLDNLNGNDPTTLIKFGSDISRVISAIDWRARELKNNSHTIDRTWNEAKEGADA